MSVASDRLAAYLAAEASILSGQRTRFDGMELQLPDLKMVQDQIRILQRQVADEQRQAANTDDVGPRVIASDFNDGCGISDYGRLYID